LYKLFATADEVAQLETFYRQPLQGADRREGRPFGYGDAKKMLLEKINTYFAPFREKRKQLLAQPEVVDDVLRRGAARAREQAQQTMALVRQAVGMLPRPVV
jgi:tryptophanyl-tRNA synthetase